MYSWLLLSSGLSATIFLFWCSNYFRFLFCCYLFFLAVQHGLSDLSSLNRDQTVPPTVEAWSPNHWAARELPVPVLTSESLFKLFSVSFWYHLSFLRGCQESDTIEQLTDTIMAWCSSNLVLSQLQLYNHSNRNQDLGTRCSYCYWGVISSKASQVDIAGNTCVNVYIYVHISIFSVHICAAFSNCEKFGFHTQYIYIFAQF